MFFGDRYSRLPYHASRIYLELRAAGIVVKNQTEQEWRRKNLSSCILASDPECLPEKGKVITKSSCHLSFKYIEVFKISWAPIGLTVLSCSFSADQRPSCGLPVRAGELLQGGWEQRGAGESQDQC